MNGSPTHRTERRVTEHLLFAMLQEGENCLPLLARASRPMSPIGYTFVDNQMKCRSLVRAR